MHAAAPAVLFKPGGHALDDVAPAAGTKRPAGLSQHDVAPAKSVNFPAGHAAQLPPLAPLKKRPAGQCFGIGSRWQPPPTTLQQYPHGLPAVGQLQKTLHPKL
jgi:hypothetical protein